MTCITRTKEICFREAQLLYKILKLNRHDSYFKNYKIKYRRKAYNDEVTVLLNGKPANSFRAAQDIIFYRFQPWAEPEKILTTQYSYIDHIRLRLMCCQMRDRTVARPENITNLMKACDDLIYKKHITRIGTIQQQCRDELNPKG